MHEPLDTITARLHVLSRPLLGVAAAVVVAAVGAASHGFVAKRGGFTPIDHPRATTVPAVPSGQAGTATLGINDRGESVGSFIDADGAYHGFLLERGRFKSIAGDYGTTGPRNDEGRSPRSGLRVTPNR
jgi:hypothetical protein